VKWSALWATGGDDNIGEGLRICFT